jgi:hypothetical protein
MVKSDRCSLRKEGPNDSPAGVFSNISSFDFLNTFFSHKKNHSSFALLNRYKQAFYARINVLNVPSNTHAMPPCRLLCHVMSKFLVSAHISHAIRHTTLRIKANLNNYNCYYYKFQIVISLVVQVSPELWSTQTPTGKKRCDFDRKGKQYDTFHAARDQHSTARNPFLINAQNFFPEK